MSKLVTLSVVGIGPEQIEFYNQVAERVERSLRFGISRHLCDAGLDINAFKGVLLQQKDWTLRRGLENQGSMRPEIE